MPKTFTNADKKELEQAFLKEQYRQLILIELKRDYLKAKHSEMFGKEDKDVVAKMKMDVDAHQQKVDEINDMITWLENRK